MLNVSDAYKTNISSYMRELKIRVVIAGYEINNQYIKNMKLMEVGTSLDRVSIGDVCSNSVELDLFKPDMNIHYDKAKIVIECGLKVDEDIEWVSLGTYYVKDVTKEQYTIHLVAYDVMQRLDKQYELEQFNEKQMTLVDVVHDIANQCMITLEDQDLTQYQNIIIDQYPTEITCKELLGYMAGLMGCNAKINRLGKLEFYWFKESGLSIDSSLIYQDSFQMSEDELLVVHSLTSGSEENTLVSGQGKGISFANPYMNQERLDDIYHQVQGLTYQPCLFKWRGNPALEIGDMITYKHQNILIINQTMIFDGGLSCEIECSGKIEDNVVMKTSSPTDIKLNKLYHTLIEAFQKSSEVILGHQGGHFVIDCDQDGKPSGWTIMDTETLQDNTKMWKFTSGGLGYSVDGGKTLTKIAFDLDGNFNANVVTTGVLSGEMFELDLESGTVKIGIRDEKGEINQPVFYLNEKGELTIKAIEKIEEAIKDIDRSSYIYSIENSGTIIHENDIELVAKVYNNNEDVTQDVDELAFCWIRESGNSENDSVWNDAHKGKRSITVTSDDVDVSANFYCQIAMSFGIQRTSAISIIDNNDIASLGNSYLDVTGAHFIQCLNNKKSYSPDYTLTPAVITPCILDGISHVDLKECQISYKRIENGQESTLGDGETVHNGILTISKNIMNSDKSSLTYVCDVTYKNTSIRLYRSFMLNIAGQDGKSITSVSVYYALGDSNIEPPEEGWTTATINRPSGQYLWKKEVTIFSDDSVSESSPIIIGEDTTVISNTAPDDISKIWYDTTIDQFKHYDQETQQWEIVNDINSLIQQMSITEEHTNETISKMTGDVQTITETVTTHSETINQIQSDILTLTKNTEGLSAEIIEKIVTNDTLDEYVKNVELHQWINWGKDNDEHSVLTLGSSEFDTQTRIRDDGFYIDVKGVVSAYFTKNGIHTESIDAISYYVGSFEITNDNSDNLVII